MSDPIPFFKPHITEDMVQAVAETIRSGWLTTGPQTADNTPLECKCFAKMKLYQHKCLEVLAGRLEQEVKAKYEE